jgi:hypothetical protein
VIGLLYTSSAWGWHTARPNIMTVTGRSVALHSCYHSLLTSPASGAISSRLFGACMQDRQPTVGLPCPTRKSFQPSFQNSDPTPERGRGNLGGTEHGGKVGILEAGPLLPGRPLGRREPSRRALPQPRISPRLTPIGKLENLLTYRARS